MTKKISEMTSRELAAYKKYLQSDAYKKSQQKYLQSDAYKKSQQKYHQSDAYKKYQQKYHQSDAYKKSQQKYHQSDAYKKSQQKYHQSDAYKKSQQKYLQSDAYKKSQQKYLQSDAYKKYLQSDAYKNKNTISDLKEIYRNQLVKIQKELRKYSIPPIALEGKAVMLKEILDNLDIIKEHTDKLDNKVKYKTIEKMINQLLEKEGILVSRRSKLTRWQHATILPLRSGFLAVA